MVLLLATGCTPSCPEPGSKAPDFNLQSIDGQKVSLSSFKGKRIMVNLWSVRCAPCVAEMPHIQEIHEKGGNNNLVVLTVNISDSSATAKEFVAEKKYTFPVLLDRENKVTQLYCLPQVIPISLFIDAEGIMRAKKIGAFRSVQEIEGMIDGL